MFCFAIKKRRKSKQRSVKQYQRRFSALALWLYRHTSRLISWGSRRKQNGDRLLAVVMSCSEKESSGLNREGGETQPTRFFFFLFMRKLKLVEILGFCQNNMPANISLNG